MREYGIPMSGPMVLATLRDQKTVTRRVVKMPRRHGKWQPMMRGGKPELGWITSPHPRRNRFGLFVEDLSWPQCPQRDIVPCPYGERGDRLWVREAHFYTSSGHVIYQADYPQNAIARGLENVPPTLAAVKAAGYRWRPSFFLPRRDARILAENMKVRVERLHDITYADIIAEGLHDWLTDEQQTDASHRDEARRSFARLWDSLNAKRGFPWESNPWVWVIRYRRLTTAEVAA